MLDVLMALLVVVVGGGGEVSLFPPELSCLLKDNFKQLF